MIRKNFLFFVFFSLISLTTVASERAKYVFYFIGDGMGVNQINGTETFLAATEGYIGTSPLCFASFPCGGLVTTYSSSNGVTDSAAGGTALATGCKTKNGTLGLSSDHTSKIYSIAHRAKLAGLAVGVGTTVSVDHATPAAFYAHVPNRNEYYRIGKQLIEADFDFYAGSDFLITESKETGEKDLYTQCFEAGYTIARGYEDCQNKLASAGKLVLLQTEDASARDRSCLPYAIDRGEGDLSLEQITKTAIDFLLRKNKDGFFLMLEGGKIDWACHSNDAAACFREVVDMDKAVQIAFDFYKKHPDETLIVVSADHETGGIVLGTGSYELHTDLLEHQLISAECFSKLIAEQYKSDCDGFTWDFVCEQLKKYFGFWDGVNLDSNQTERLKKAYDNFCSGVAKDSKTLYASENIIAKTARLILADKACIGWQSGGHSNGYVPVFAVGVGSENFVGRIDNTQIAPIIARVGGFSE